MRCRFCGASARWWRRRCRDCQRLWAVWLANRAAGMGGLLEAFAATGADAEKIRRFLDAEPVSGGGTVRDRIAADMANQLLGALGQQGRQRGEDVKRLRERGVWKSYDQPPE